MTKTEFWMIAATGFLFILLAVCARGSDKHCWLPEGCKNTTATPVYQDNPFTYKAGTVNVSGNLENGLVLRIQPIGTYTLFTEDILICGRPADLFQGKTNPLVLTYRTKANRTIDSVGCHELVHVDSLKPYGRLGE